MEGHLIENQNSEIFTFKYLLIITQRSKINKNTSVFNTLQISLKIKVIVFHSNPTTAQVIFI